MGYKAKPAIGLVAVIILLFLCLERSAIAQNPAAKTNEPGDLQLQLAMTLVGKGLFLRGFYLNNDLAYDAAGRVVGAPKMGAWTVAAVNVLKAERLGPKEIELDGVRAAIRYNPEANEFQRHPLNDEKVKILVADSEDFQGFEAAIRAIFSMGIDPALQRAMPDFWRHYFDPKLPWPQDSLSGQTIYSLAGGSNQAKDVSPPKVDRQAEAKFPSFAQRDKVQGTVLLRIVVDPEGVPRRIALTRPLGYELDESAVEAMAKWHFQPGMKDGKPVAVGIMVQQEFSAPAPPGR
ncbi:MAG: TonB family protein [Edaphobacter sp.]|nr:TonB family protein [Edaphobacter sp.]